MREDKGDRSLCVRVPRRNGGSRRRAAWHPIGNSEATGHALDRLYSQYPGAVVWVHAHDDLSTVRCEYFGPAERSWLPGKQGVDFGFECLSPPLRLDQRQPLIHRRTLVSRSCQPGVLEHALFLLDKFQNGQSVGARRQ